MKEKKLGKGLNMLFSDNDNDQGAAQAVAIPETAKVEQTSQGESKLITLSLAQIYPNKNQPRKKFDEDNLNQLAASIRQEGVVQPVIVRRNNGNFELVSGERRWRAAQKAELKSIPAIVVDVDDNRSLHIALIENIQREDLNPIEKAKAFKDIVDKTSCTQEELAERIGQDRSTLANFMRLLDLPEEVQAAVSRGTISMGHARAILSVQGERRQRELARRVEKDGISVRKLENVIRLGGKRSQGKASISKDPGIAEIAQKLTEFFGTRVTIEAGRKRGRIIIDYYENSQFNDILTKLNIVV